MRSSALILAVAVAAGAASAQPSPTAQQRKAAKAHFEQGRAFYEAGAWPDAIREYEKAWALMPLPELLFNIGQAYRMQGDKPKAIDAYRRYLDRLPDGPLAEEARNHIAALTLKIRIDEVEAARKKATEGEAAARKQAAEAEAARRRAEGEATARAKARQEDEERLRRVAGEEAARQRRAKEVAAAARQEAGRTARGVWAGGWTLLVAGTITVVGAIMAGQDVLHNLGEARKFNPPGEWSSYVEGVWSSDYQSHVSRAKTLQKVVLGLSIGGGALVAGGIAMLNVAGVKRSRAYKRVERQLTLIPALGPGSGALVLAGGF